PQAPGRVPRPPLAQGHPRERGAVAGHRRLHHLHDRSLPHPHVRGVLPAASVDGLLRAPLLVVLLAGCRSPPPVVTPPGALTPAKAEGGLVRAVFGSRASRARLQWKNVTATNGNACRSSLRAWGITFSPLPDRAAPDAKLCGIPHGVQLAHGPSGIAWQPALVLDCSMALLLPEVEAVIQRVASATLGQRIARIRTFGTYSCRDMVGWLGTKSEHSFANAIDIAAFDTADGK